MKLIQYAKEQQAEEMIYQRWINGYQHIPYAQFRMELGVQKDSSNKENTQPVKVENVLNDVNHILQMER